jgi:uncharacterized protein (DUF362 family)
MASSPLLTRRSVLIGGATAAISAAVLAQQAWLIGRQPRARVARIAAKTYDVDLVGLRVDAISEFPASVARAKGGRVVLKPNLVEFDPTRPINTDPRVVVAAAEAFRRLGAAEVIVAEGPGHRRDTEYVVEATGLREHLDHERLRFVDLNVDHPYDVPLPTNLTGFGKLRIGGTAMGADLLVSMPKLKTHHWAGATLSMKNLFGLVPGAVYGWPKNPLHFGGIDNSIIDLWRGVDPGFAIVDGIVGMEGDGPIRGSAKQAGVLVLGDNLSAVDAVCARQMGLHPHQIEYLRLAVSAGGTVSRRRIDVMGDDVAPVAFEVVERFAHLRARV